jgi:antitoxin CcdA
MHQEAYDQDAPKRPVNIRMNSDLVAQAKEMKINLSKELENHLVELVAERQRRAWKEENQVAIEQYNDRIVHDGLFSDGLRQF